MPLLLVLLLGMIDFGKAFTDWIDQTHLANLGARLAAVSYCPDPTQAPPVGDCGWAAKGCPVSGAPQNACLAWYVSQRADLPDVKSGHAANDYVTAQNAARVCVWYPDATYSGSPTSCTSTCGATPSATPRPGDRVEVTVVGVYHWLKYLTNRANLATTRVVGKATMRLETPPSTAALSATGCYPNTPAGT
jgi:Flp pilus assembly protein TadG